jgi:hypothetical protein
MVKAKNYHYETVSEAINELKQKGFALDFNLEENCIICNESKFESDEFDILEVYRYEGNSDPADEATVYGIQSKSGLKGVLVLGDTTTLDNKSTAIVKKLFHNKI